MLELGVYTLRIVKAAANAGDFVLVNPQGYVVGAGTVAVAFNQVGISFTLADGATDFIVGDTIPITIAGVEKWKLVEATATDGTQVPRAVMISDTVGNTFPIATTLSTDVTVIGMYRGPGSVAGGALVFGASVTAGAVRTAMLASFTATSGIEIDTQFN